MIIAGIALPSIFLTPSYLTIYDQFYYSGEELEYIRATLRNEGTPFYRGLGEFSLAYLPIELKKAPDQTSRCYSDRAGDGTVYDLRVVGVTYFFLPTGIRDVCEYIPG